MSEEWLAVPPKAEENLSGEAPWTVVARNERVNRAWKDLMRTAGENATKCYRHLCFTPMVRRPGRIFPLRGKRYKGAWEYEITSGDRVFYFPEPKLKKVTVYYAGPHMEPAPLPPGDLTAST